MTSTPSIRPEAVAGTFYPSDARVLAQTVDALIAAAPAAAAEPPHALLSPHAGYAYSGAVAARAFRRLQAVPARSFVLVGPSHVEAFRFSSVFEGDAYRTPLGEVAVDTALARAIAKHARSIRLSPHGHVNPRLSRGEHGLEVLLPFLQRVVPGARIVPIVMGSQAWEAVEELGAAIADAADPAQTIVVASSDLSHFHDYEEATRLDAVFCDTLERSDGGALFEAVSEGRCEACGAGPVVAAMLASRRWHADACRVLARANSGDVTGDRSSVVGYAAAVITAGSSA